MVNVQEWNCWVVCKVYIQIKKKKNSQTIFQMTIILHFQFSYIFANIHYYFYVSYPCSNLIVIITWISLKASDTEYLIMSFLLFSLVKYPFIFLVHFLTAFYCYESFSYILDESFVRYLLHKYFPMCSLSCHPNKILHRAKIFNFDDIQFTFFFTFMDYSFDVVYRFLSNPTSQSYFSYVIFQSSTGLHFILNLRSILSLFL